MDGVACVWVGLCLLGRLCWLVGLFLCAWVCVCALLLFFGLPCLVCFSACLSACLPVCLFCLHAWFASFCVAVFRAGLVSDLFGSDFISLACWLAGWLACFRPTRLFVALFLVSLCCCFFVCVVACVPWLLPGLLSCLQCCLVGIRDPDYVPGTASPSLRARARGRSPQQSKC